MKFIIEDDYNFRVYNRSEQEVFHYQYDPALKLAIQTWQNYIPDEDIIRVFQYLSQFAVQHKQLIIASINNIEAVDGSFDGIREWLAQEYMPIAVKYGFRYTATVRPTDFYAQLALNEAESIPQDLGYTAQYFDNYAEAYQWITQQLTGYLTIK
jgi:hypothetical protein